MVDEKLEARKLEERKKILRKIYSTAYDSGLCETKKAFASLVGQNYTVLISAMNGNKRDCTDLIVECVNEKMIELGVISEPITLEHIKDQLPPEKPASPKEPEDSPEDAKMEDIMSSMLQEMMAINSNLCRLTSAIEKLSKLDRDKK